MKFSTLILVGLVLVVACASADDSTSAATTASSTTSTTVKPKSCNTNELNNLKDSLCEKLFIKYPFLTVFGDIARFGCKVFVGNAVNILKCDCGIAA